MYLTFHLHISHYTPCLAPTFCIIIVFISLGTTLIPWRYHKGYTKFGGTNKAYYGDVQMASNNASMLCEDMLYVMKTNL